MIPSARATILAAVVASSACSTAKSQGSRVPGSGEPPLALLVTHEEVVVRPDGVTQSLRFQERMIREGGRVWIERVVDPRVAKPHERAHGPGHHVHDWSTATRFFTKGAGESGRFQFVLPEDRELVDVVPTEYDLVGIYPVWSELARLIDTNDLSQLEPSPKRPKHRDARWLEKKDGKRFVRVLFSDALQVALEIEAGQDDGTVNRRLSAEVEAMPEHLPWESIGEYARKDVNDFRD